MRQALLLMVGFGAVVVTGTGCQSSACVSQRTFTPTIDQYVPRVAPPPFLPPQTVPPPLAPAEIKPSHTPRTSATKRPDLSTW